MHHQCELKFRLYRSSLPTGYFFMLFCCLLIFFYCFFLYKKINFFENFSHEYHQIVKQFGPGLGPNCLQKLSADDTNIEGIKLKPKSHRIAAIENVNTIDESRSKIFRNRVVDFHLSPNWRKHCSDF